MAKPVLVLEFGTRAGSSWKPARFYKTYVEWMTIYNLPREQGGGGGEEEGRGAGPRCNCAAMLPGVLMGREGELRTPPWLAQRARYSVFGKLVMLKTIGCWATAVLAAGHVPLVGPLYTSPAEVGRFPV